MTQPQPIQVTVEFFQQLLGAKEVQIQLLAGEVKHLREQLQEAERQLQDRPAPLLPEPVFAKNGAT